MESLRRFRGDPSFGQRIAICFSGVSSTSDSRLEYERMIGYVISYN